MIASDIDFPAGLPDALRDGYGLEHVSPFERTSMQSGRSRSRRTFTSVPTRADVAWFFTENQAAAFEAWFRDEIHDGVDWFNCTLRTPVGVGKYVCQFAEMYRGPILVGVNYWRVSAKLEIWERPLMPEGWGDFPWFVTGASIFDMAMNREWPAHAAGAPEIELLSEDDLFLLLESSGTEAVKISQLPLAQPLTGNEYIPVVQSGVTKKSKASDISKSDTTNYALYYGISKD
ncbi:hypothetical protein [Pusillimonas noertemannii]|uniref:Uncharacterized protein n=1 Tax=Pusillimonas noertemannii TaxID=305977 RepID=A0A2U1CS16_9BURK|nr:hypothetical protein [Pusillimonas noertemannii]PVY68663.1 hypothetical protein C7440_1074 [Pusillimonas noertemannii]